VPLQNGPKIQNRLELILPFHVKISVSNRHDELRQQFSTIPNFMHRSSPKKLLRIFPLRRFDNQDRILKVRLPSFVERRERTLQLCLPCIFDERDFVSFGEVSRYVFVKGNCIFVYGQETDSNPFYAIPIETVRAVLEDPKNPDRHSVTISPSYNTNDARKNLETILLKDRSTGKQAYQFTFDTTSDRSLGKRFLELMTYKEMIHGEDVMSASVVKTKEIGENYARTEPNTPEKH
jgi:hypothetical protein